uniref:Uncharacterized protein n=1 Tax=Arundo donax TaxID=35708 RepID=A0A0A9D696_ARUDO
MEGGMLEGTLCFRNFFTQLKYCRLLSLDAGPQLSTFLLLNLMNAQTFHMRYSCTSVDKMVLETANRWQDYLFVFCW